MATKAKESSKQPTTAPTPTITVSTGTEAQLCEEVFEVFRRWGYLQATLDQRLEPLDERLLEGLRHLQRATANLS